MDLQERFEIWQKLAGSYMSSDGYCSMDRLADRTGLEIGSLINMVIDKYGDGITTLEGMNAWAERVMTAMDLEEMEEMCT